MSKLDNLKRTRRRRDKTIQRLTRKLSVMLERARLTDADIGHELAKREQEKTRFNNLARGGE